MADSKIVKNSKSKSINNSKSTKLLPQLPVKTSSGTLGLKNEIVSKKRSGVPGSVLDKLDLDNLKETALKTMKAGINSSAPATREACIEYALDMVISNLILNGHLDATKAQQMRNPLMKTRIAAICEDMILAKKEISNASIAKYFQGRKKNTPKSGSKKRSRSRNKGERWAIQPTSLPITIITDGSFNLNKLPKFTMMEKMAMGLKEPGSAKSLSNNDFKNIMKDPKKNKSGPKSRTKSLDPSSERNKPSPKPDRSLSPRTPLEKRNVYHQQASSEVPSSDHSFENGFNPTSSINNVTEPSTNKASQPTDNIKTSESYKYLAQLQVEEYKKNVVLSASLASLNSSSGKSEDKKNKEGHGVETPAKPLSKTPSFEKRVFTPAPVSSPFAISSTRTLNTLINSSNCSVSSATSTAGYRCLVDLKGFQNDEISMEVEGRHLIFLASRPKRGEMNVRKVTEIVDVPRTVNMENLKIGRRMDGYVLIEEHDTT